MGGYLGSIGAVTRAPCLPTSASTGPCSQVHPIAMGSNDSTTGSTTTTTTTTSLALHSSPSSIECGKGNR